LFIPKLPENPGQTHCPSVVICSVKAVQNVHFFCFFSSAVFVPGFSLSYLTLCPNPRPAPTSWPLESFCPLPRPYHSHHLLRSNSGQGAAKPQCH
jgi:hypothetical protein